jgi:hypothetical protein
VIRHAQARERTEPAAAHEAGDPTERRAPAGVKRALAPAGLLERHVSELLRRGNLTLASEKYDAQASAPAQGTGPNRLTQGVDHSNRALAEARNAPRERTLGAERRSLLRLSERRSVVVVRFSADRHVSTSLTTDSTQ